MDDKEPILTDRTPTLDRLSVEELREYILKLKAEIDACEGEISRKIAQKSAADAIFKTS